MLDLFVCKKTTEVITDDNLTVSPDRLACAVENLSTYSLIDMATTVLAIIFLSFLAILVVAGLLNLLIRNKPDAKGLAKYLAHLFVIVVGGISIIIFAFDRQDPLINTQINNTKVTINNKIADLNTSNTEAINQFCKNKFEINSKDKDIVTTSTNKMVACSYHIYLEQHIKSIKDIALLTKVTEKEYLQKNEKLLMEAEKLQLTFDAHKKHDNSNTITDRQKLDIEISISNLNDLLLMLKTSSEMKSISSRMILFIFMFAFATALELALHSYDKIKRLAVRLTKWSVPLIIFSYKEVKTYIWNIWKNLFTSPPSSLPKKVDVEKKEKST